MSTFAPAASSAFLGSMSSACSNPFSTSAATRLLRSSFDTAYLLGWEDRMQMRLQRGLHLPAHAAVDRAAVHAERRLARERLDAVEGVHGRVAIGKHAEHVLRADAQQETRGQAVGRLEVGQPFRAEDLVVGGISGEAAELTVAAQQDIRPPLVALPVGAGAQAVVRLAALNPAPLDALEQHLIEAGALSRRGPRAHDFRPRVVIAQ